MLAFMRQGKQTFYHPEFVKKDFYKHYVEILGLEHTS
jgi:hypothetical protein